MHIKDGTGKGYLAKVNNDNQIEVKSISLSEFAHRASLGYAFSWTAISADIDAGDTALLIANESSTLNLHITSIYCWCDIEQQFKIHVPAYPTLAGTAVVGVNLNRASNIIAPASAYADETGNTLSDANVILTLHSNELATDQFYCEHHFEGALILGEHDCIAVDLVAEPGAFECSIRGYFK